MVVVGKKAGHLFDAIHELLKPDGLNLRQLFLENKQFHGQRLYRLGVHLSRKRHCKGHLSSHFWRRFFCYFALIFVSKKKNIRTCKKTESKLYALGILGGVMRKHIAILLTRLLCIIPSKSIYAPILRITRFFRHFVARL